MTKKIFEELPARKHSPAAAAPAAVAKGGERKGGEGEGSEKKIRQAVYDIRYRARREGIDLRAAFAQYMQNSNLSAPEQAAVRAKLFGKDGGGAKEVKEERTAADPDMKNRMGKGLKMSGAITKDGKYNNPYSGGPKKELVDKKIKMRMAADASRAAAAAASEPKKNRRGRELPEDTYDATMTNGATDAVANALFQVFVEKNLQQEVTYEDEMFEEAERKYKVRVLDPNTEKSYVRYATREKITQLRAKGLKVEMTEHGDPYEGKRKEVPNKGGLDKPVHPSKRDGDVNDDGKKDGTDKYIYNRRDAINAAIAKRKQQNEEFLVDGTTSTEGQNKGKITGTGVDNSSRITVNPDSKVDGPGMKARKGLYAHTEVEGEMIAEKAVSKSQQKFMAMVCQVKKGKMDAPSPEVAKAAKEMSEKDACDYAETKHEGLPEKKEVKEGKDDKMCPKCKKCPCECGHMAGEKRTYRELLKNKLRAMGIRNPMMLGAPEDGEEVMKIMTASTAKMTTESSCGSHGKKKKKK